MHKVLCLENSNIPIHQWTSQDSWLLRSHSRLHCDLEDLVGASKLEVRHCCPLPITQASAPLGVCNDPFKVIKRREPYSWSWPGWRPFATMQLLCRCFSSTWFPPTIQFSLCFGKLDRASKAQTKKQHRSLLARWLCNPMGFPLERTKTETKVQHELIIPQRWLPPRPRKQPNNLKQISFGSWICLNVVVSVLLCLATLSKCNVLTNLRWFSSNSEMPTNLFPRTCYHHCDCCCYCGCYGHCYYLVSTW